MKKKTKYPANIHLIEKYDLEAPLNFKVMCTRRQTKEHIVRQMNVKSTFIHGKI